MEYKVWNQSGIYPTADKIVVLTAKIEEKTAGGLVIPKQVQDKENVAAQNGTLIAVGPAARLMNELDGIEAGDLVVYARYAGVTLPGKDGQVYRLMRATDVIAKADGVYDTQLLSKPQATPFV
jgi:chaperonin GroES